MRKVLLAATLLMLTPVALAAAPAITLDASATAFRRLPALERGINLSGWFASSGDLSAAHIATQTTPADLALIHDLGFTYVRLGVDPVQFQRFGSPETNAAVARLDNAINEILAAHLAVSLCVFPTDDYKHGLAADNGTDRFVQLWRELAQHYAPADPDRLFYELINEPEVGDPYRWDGLQAATIQAVRRADPTHTIIATAAHYSGIDDLLHVIPVRDGNVIYNFHFYEPYPFTHQGASWGSFEWNFYKDIPYPATAEQLQAAMQRVPDDNARYTLYLYGASGWNRNAIQGRLSFARAWADEHHVPIICNEFGAYRSTAPSDSRLRWIHDVRSSLEALHIGWAMWDYSGDFGVVTKPNGQAVADPATVEALGLRKH